MFCHGCYNGYMKKLLTLIKSKGKTKKQLASEVKDLLKVKGILDEDDQIQIIFHKKSPQKNNDHEK